MLKKLSKRILTIMIGIIMIISISGQVFAHDTTCLNNKYEATVDSYEIMLIGAMVGGTMEETGNILFLYPELDSWALTRKIHIWSYSDTKQGGLFLKLYDPKGKLISDDWILGTTDDYTWTIWWPTVGKYTLEITGITDAPVTVYANFEE